MYAQRGHGKRSSFYSDYTFGAWRGDALVPVGKAYSGFTDEELRRLDNWVRSHTTNRFGPVREVEPKLVLEVAFDSVHRSNRHKSGIAMADVGWTDNTAQNGLFNVVVTPLGYKTKIDVLDLPVILEGLKNKKLDLFLDNWLPSNEDGTKPYRDAHTIDELPPDLTDAPYGPVVPNYVAEAGVKDIKDLGPNAEKFSGKFYGIEPGNDGNKIVQKAIDDPKNNMAGCSPSIVEPRSGFSRTNDRFSRPGPRRRRQSRSRQPMTAAYDNETLDHLLSVGCTRGFI